MGHYGPLSMRLCVPVNPSHPVGPKLVDTCFVGAQSCGAALVTIFRKLLNCVPVDT